jgi:uncharacterized protein DUF1905
MSRAERFETVVLEGHKGLAFELPFDPAERWGVPEERLWPGRRGWRVKVSMRRARFESFVVPRSRRFWVLVSEEMRRSGRLRAGSRVGVAVAPASFTPPSPAGRGL